MLCVPKSKMTIQVGSVLETVALGLNPERQLGFARSDG